VGQSRCVCRSYRCCLSCAIHHLFQQSSRLPFILLLYFLPLGHIISEMVVLVLAASPLRPDYYSCACFGSDRRAHQSSPSPSYGSSDSLHFLPTAAGYRYELNQLVYSLILMLILILILYSISPTPNRFCFPS